MPDDCRPPTLEEEEKMQESLDADEHDFDDKFAKDEIDPLHPASDGTEEVAAEIEVEAPPDKNKAVVAEVKVPPDKNKTLAAEMAKRRRGKRSKRPPEPAYSSMMDELRKKAAANWSCLASRVFQQFA